MAKINLGIRKDVHLGDLVRYNDQICMVTQDDVTWYNLTALSGTNVGRCLRQYSLITHLDEDPDVEFICKESEVEIRRVKNSNEIF